MEASDELNDIRNRIQRLESTNRQYRRIVAVSIICVTIGSALGLSKWQETKKTITAQEIQLTDDQGRIRARLYTSDTGAYLGFWDETDQHRINVGVQNGAPILAFGDGIGKSRVIVHPTSEQTELTLYDGDQNIVWQVNEKKSRTSSQKDEAGAIDKQEMVTGDLTAGQGLAKIETGKVLDKTDPIVVTFETDIKTILHRCPGPTEEQIAATISKTQSLLKERNVEIKLSELSRILAAALENSGDDKISEFSEVAGVFVVLATSPDNKGLSLKEIAGQLSALLRELSDK